VLRGSVAAGFLVCLTVIFVVRDAHLGTGFGWTSAPSRLPNLNAGDDYDSVLKKLGSPASDRWLESRNGPGGYRRLWYPRRAMTVILTGASRDSARYAGTLNRDGEIIQAVDSGLTNELYSAPVIH
jgi:hypothetical protein